MSKHIELSPQQSVGYFGMVVAMVMSWTANHSVVWVILHGLIGWIYVVARLVGCANGEP